MLLKRVHRRLPHIVGRPGSVSAVPCNRAGVSSELFSDDCGIGVQRIPLAPLSGRSRLTLAPPATRQRTVPRCRRDARNRLSIGRAREHGIHDGGVTTCNHLGNQ
jgi:hypothetical protein